MSPRLYSSVVMSFRFILQSKEEINNQLMDKQKTADEKIKELEVPIRKMRLITFYVGVCVCADSVVSFTAKEGVP